MKKFKCKKFLSIFMTLVMVCSILGTGLVTPVKAYAYRNKNVLEQQIKPGSSAEENIQIDNHEGDKSDKSIQADKSLGTDIKKSETTTQGSIQVDEKNANKEDENAQNNKEIPENPKTTEDSIVPTSIKIEAPVQNEIKVGNNGDKFILKANVYDQNNKIIDNQKIKWISGNETIAKVDESGKVVGMQVGPVVITASVEGKNDTIELNVVENKVKVYIRVEGYDHTIIPREEIEVPLTNIQPYLGPASGSSATKTNGWGVDKFNKPSVAHALVKALLDHGYTKGDKQQSDVSGKGKFDMQDYGWSCYLAMIDGDREMKKGKMSGWMYRVNDVLPAIGCQGTSINDGDEIVWYYGSYGFDNVYTKTHVDKTNVKLGENIKIKIDGYAGGYQNEISALEDAKILVNDVPYKDIKTDSNGEAVLSFNVSGIYTISLDRVREKGKEAGYKDIVRPIPITIKVAQGDGTLPTVSVTDIRLDKTSKELNVGEIFQLKAIVLPENAENKNLTWKSSDDKIATVDEKGKITCIKEGEVEITAVTQDGGKSASCKINIKSGQGQIIPISELKFDVEELKMKSGEKQQLNLSILPENASKTKLYWETDNYGVAIVDENGMVTAVGAGEANIKVVTTDGSKRAECKIKVEEVFPLVIENLSGVNEFKKGREANVIFKATNMTDKVQDVNLSIYVENNKDSSSGSGKKRKKIKPGESIELKVKFSLNNEDDYIEAYVREYKISDDGHLMSDTITIPIK